jgi:hypothetical protein
MKIEGERVKRFRVFRCDKDNHPYEIQGEYDTVAELRAHRWLADRHYKIAVAGKFYTRPEFDEWIKTQHDCEAMRPLDGD